MTFPELRRECPTANNVAKKYPFTVVMAYKQIFIECHIQCVHSLKPGVRATVPTGSLALRGPRQKLSNPQALHGLGTRGEWIWNRRYIRKYINLINVRMDRLAKLAVGEHFTGPESVIGISSRLVNEDINGWLSFSSRMHQPVFHDFNLTPLVS